VNPDSTAFFVLVGFEVTVAKLALHHRISAERFLTASAYTSPQPNKDRFLSVVLPKTMGEGGGGFPNRINKGLCQRSYRRGQSRRVK